MLGDIDYKNKPQEYSLILCKPNKEQIAILSEAFNINYKAKFNGIDELDFTIPYYVMDNNFRQIVNPNFDLLKGDYLILLNNEKYFVVNLPKSEGGEGKDVKNAHCFSYEYILSDKRIRNFKGTRKLYDTTDEKAGILNLLEEKTSWRVGYVDSKVAVDDSGTHDRYRTFDVSEKTWIEFFEEIKTAFNCIIKFDTINKLINVYHIDNIGEHKGLYISEENYLKTISKEMQHEPIVTRLSVYGKDNISISSVNPLGTVYIDDFSFYRNADYMSESLRNALDNFDALVSSKKTEFHSYLQQLSDLQASLLVKQNELSTLNTEMKIIQDQIDTKIKTQQPYSDLNTQKANKQTEINNKQAEIDGINSNINTVTNNIITLRQLIDIKNNLTQQQLEELDDYIKEDTWQNSNIYDVDELYAEGLKAIKKINQPTMQFEIDIVDFMKLIEFQHDWDKLVLGDFVTINYNKFNFDIDVRLIGYTHQYDSNQLTLEFSNKESKEDALRYLGDMLASNSNATTTLEIFKHVWDMSENNGNWINDFINNALDATKQNVLAGRNQETVIDERGIHLKDVENDAEQIRLMNNIIAFSKDGFQTASLGITPDGIVGEAIYSKIIGSEKLEITNTLGTFKVDGNQMTATDMSLTLNRKNSTSKIILNPEVGIKIENAGIDQFYADTNGTLILDGQLSVKNNGIRMLEGYQDTNGGKIKVYDNQGFLNVSIGVESGNTDNDNTGGTIILYKDSWYDTSPLSDSYQRVALGILKNEDCGIIQLKDYSGYPTLSMNAGNDNQGTGAEIQLLDTYGYMTIKSNEITLDGGNDKMATQSWVNSAINTATSGLGNNYATLQDMQDMIAAHELAYHSV